MARSARGRGAGAVRNGGISRRPLLPAELAEAAAVVLDPPYAGAAAQMPLLARAEVPRVILVSCHPAALARDARPLRAAGYTVLAATPIDQFPFSAHLESGGGVSAGLDCSAGVPIMRWQPREETHDHRPPFALAAAGAAVALAAEPTGPATAQPAAAANPLFFRTRVGERVLTILLDGIAIRQNPGEGFVRNADRAAVEASLRARGLPTDRLINPYCVAALDTPRGIILFDAGTGGHLAPTARGVLPAMQAAGLDPARVATVVLTHYHADHISGLTDAAGQPVFPNAEVVVPAAEHAFWTDPARCRPPGRRGAECGAAAGALSGAAARKSPPMPRWHPASAPCPPPAIRPATHPIW